MVQDVLDGHLCPQRERLQGDDQPRLGHDQFPLGAELCVEALILISVFADEYLGDCADVSLVEKPYRKGIDMLCIVSAQHIADVHTALANEFPLGFDAKVGIKIIIAELVSGLKDGQRPQVGGWGWAGLSVIEHGGGLGSM